MSSSAIKYIDTQKVKSKWHKDLLSDWQPDKNYLEHLKTQLLENHYIAPVVVVHEQEGYFIVNGHHRLYAHLEQWFDGIEKR